MKQLLIFTVIGLAAGLGLSSCNSAAEQKAGPGSGGPGGAAAVKSYSVITLEPKPVTAHLNYPATIQGLQVIEIRPMISGYIQSIDVHEGATVRKGQVLFTIKNPQYEQDVRSAEAAIKSAEADVASAKMSVAKVKPLVDKEIVSKYQLESAEYTLQSKVAALAEAKATLENARINQGYTVIRSTHDGVIGTIPYKIGALVSSTSSSALTNLSDISKVYAYFALDEKQLLQLQEMKPGAFLQELVDKLPGVQLLLADGSVFPYKGKLEAASGIITTGTGSISFKALFPNPNGVIRSGASAIVRIPRDNDSAIIIPQSATSEIQDKRLVYVVGEGDKIHPVAVNTTATDDGKYYIVSKGLSSGDRIVLDGITSLKDSLQIKPLSVKDDSVYSKLQTGK